MYDNLKHLLDGIKVIVPKEMGRDIINSIAKEIVQQYNLEINNVDFERIYKKGYEDKENWEEDYILSYKITMENYKYTHKIEDEDIEFYEYGIECC